MVCGEPVGNESLACCSEAWDPTYSCKTHTIPVPLIRDTSAMWTLECVPFGTGLKSKVLSEDFAVVLLIINSGNSIYVIKSH